MEISGVMERDPKMSMSDLQKMEFKQAFQEFDKVMQSVSIHITALITLP